MRFPWQRASITTVASCPSCACDVGTPVLKAYRHAGAEREHVGTVCDCVRCGTRYTVLHAGGVVALMGAPRATSAHAGTAQPGTDRVAGGTGGARDGRGGWLDDDMVTFPQT